MKDVDFANSALVVVECASGVRLKQWPNEQQAIVFNELSGDTFEVNAVAATMLGSLRAGALALKELMNICGEDDQEKFVEQYITPLNTLNIIQVSNL